MLYVIDAGVAVKWYIPEEDSAIAHQLLERYQWGIVHVIRLIPME